MKQILHIPFVLSIFFCTTLLGDDKSPTPGKDSAIASVTGKLICAHCDFSIGDTCCSGIQIEDVVFVLSGEADDELLDLRLNGIGARVIGTLTAKDGYLYLNGVQDKKAPADAKDQSLITGKVVADGESFALANGKSPVRIKGDALESLASQNGKWVELAGAFNVDRKGRIQLTAKSAKPVDGPPKLPVGKKKQ